MRRKAHKTRQGRGTIAAGRGGAKRGEGQRATSGATEAEGKSRGGAVRERAPHPERSEANKGGDTHTPRRAAAKGRGGEGGRGEGTGANTPDKRHGGMAERRPAEPAAARVILSRDATDALDGRRAQLKPLKGSAEDEFSSEAEPTDGEASMAEPPAYPQCIPDFVDFH